ncbi:protein of unknown function [Frankineae bacterium MT45]|nr:protein of unknown function [Frankineae bacterium MT45]
MSSHREAPEISKDPVADNTDIYAFVSPDKPDTVTIIANFIPLQNPAGGPNFFEFGDDVLYEIHISNSGDAQADVTYQFEFSTSIRNKETFLYNTGPITSVPSANWNRPQTFDVRRVTRHGRATKIGSNLTVPPVNVGVRSTPDYDKLAASTFHKLAGGSMVFCGQRGEAFFADLGSIFDLGTLRPFEGAHLIPSAAAVGVNGLQGLNVHTIAIQVPKRDLTRGGVDPKNVADATSVIGVWSSTSRRKSRVHNDSKGCWEGHGPWTQVSRLGNPLFNEVIVPMAEKDRWNRQSPAHDAAFAKYVLNPELAGLVAALYPGVFTNLAAYKKPRADLAAILLTGIPTGVVPGFQNFTGAAQADMLRLNLAVPPTATPNPIGLIAGDAAGFPNGRRPIDDVVTIELRAIAGATIPLVDKSFTPDKTVAVLSDGVPANTNEKLLSTFPYLPTPIGGYQSMPGAVPAA